MVFQLRVTLSGIKGFYRVYKGLDIEEKVVGRWGLFDLGFGTADAIPLEKAVKAGTDHFVYFYDVTNKKSVNIIVEGEIPGAAVHPDYPQLAEVKGPNPIEFENGYVAFEDLPERQRHLPGEEEDLDDEDDEDFEDEEDDEEGEDEDGEEIYDENE